jgi:hypothetical protein
VPSKSRLAPHRRAIAALPDGELPRDVLLDGGFRIYQCPAFTVHYAPFDHINERARVVLMGITPGWQQMRIAHQTARDRIRAGATDEQVLWAVKQQASFAGMRDRLAQWLDGLGVHEVLALASTSELFGVRAEMLHTTSAVRYPVLYADGKNWSGSKPAISEPVFRRFIRKALASELAAVGQALIVPLGVAVQSALADLVNDGLLDPRRCLFGFPHPSGLNASGPARYRAERQRLTAAVAEWAATARSSVVRAEVPT